jgi:hypothetical protein
MFLKILLPTKVIKCTNHITGLMRLQDTYRLDTSSLASGVLNGRYYGTSLTAHDCFELGRQTYNNGDYFHTNIWMEEALRYKHFCLKAPSHEKVDAIRPWSIGLGLNQENSNRF